MTEENVKTGTGYPTQTTGADTPKQPDKPKEPETLIESHLSFLDLANGELFGFISQIVEVINKVGPFDIPERRDRPTTVDIVHISRRLEIERESMANNVESIAYIVQELKKIL